MAKRGRQIGQKVNARDERGWKIPRAGTVGRRVYDLMLKGVGPSKIYKMLGISYQSCIMHQRSIKQSDRVSAQKYNAQHPDEPIPVPGGGLRPEQVRLVAAQLATEVATFDMSAPMSEACRVALDGLAQRGGRMVVTLELDAGRNALRNSAGALACLNECVQRGFVKHTKIAEASGLFEITAFGWFRRELAIDGQSEPEEK